MSQTPAASTTPPLAEPRTPSAGSLPPNRPDPSDPARERHGAPDGHVLSATAQNVRALRAGAQR